MKEKNTKARGRTDIDDKVIALLKAERKRAKEKFPLAHALIATVGALCTFAGLNQLIAKIDFLSNNPITMVLFGLFLLLLTGAAYKKLG